MKNKKGQIGIQETMYIFIAVIVGLILFQAVAQNVGQATNTVELVNSSQTLAANGASIYLTDYQALSSVVILNATDNTTIGAGNYTITNTVIYNGALAVKITTDDAAYASSDVRVSGTAQPLTYIADSGARSMTALITIFFALLVAVIAMSPVARSGVMDMMGK